MAWWGWLLVAWCAVAVLGSLLCGAVAATVRERERADRARRDAAPLLRDVAG